MRVAHHQCMAVGLASSVVLYLSLDPRWLPGQRFLWHALRGTPIRCCATLESVDLQEDITITGVTVFVNPYTEPDEEDEKAKEETKELTFQEQEELVSTVAAGLQPGFRRAPPCSCFRHRSSAPWP